MPTLLEMLQNQNPRVVVEVMNMRHRAIKNRAPEIPEKEAPISELMNHPAYIRVGRRIRQKESGRVIA